MTTTVDDEAAVRNLLAPLGAVEPAVRTNRRRTRAALVVVVAVALVAVGIAAADGFGPFAGIGAADHPSTPNDALDPAIQTVIAQLNARTPDTAASGRLLADTARLVGELPSGKRIYVIATTTDALCVLIQEETGTSDDSAIACGHPLTQAQPTTEETIRPNQQTPPLSFGVAKDDVTAVSFQADGVEKTIPVTHNVWAYEGSSSILHALTVHFDDGSQETLGG